MNIADRLFNAIRELNLAESNSDEAIFKMFGFDWGKPMDTYPFHDLTYDDYDGSIEFGAVQEDFEPTSDQLKMLWEMGFERCWFNYVDGTQRYASGDVHLGKKYAGDPFRCNRKLKEAWKKRMLTSEGFPFEE